MPRSKLKGRKPSNPKKSCDCCGTRLKKSDLDWRKTKCSVHRLQDKLVGINSGRLKDGKQPLSVDSKVCKVCFNLIYSSPPQSSENETSSDSESDESDSTSDKSTTNSEPECPVPDPPFNPAWAEESTVPTGYHWHDLNSTLYATWQGVDNAAPGPSRLAPTARAPWEERCLLCPLLFQHNPTTITHVLSSVRLLQVIINGELTTSGHPIAHPGSLICDPCFNDKLNEYRLQLETLRPNHMQVDERLSQGSNFSAMDISQTNNQKPDVASSQHDYVWFSSDEVESVESDESENRSPPSKKEVTKQTMLLDIPSVAVSGHSCFVCGHDGIRKRVGKKCRLGLFRTTGIYVHPENRICPEHLEPTKRRMLNADGLAVFLAQVRYEESFFTKEQLIELIKFLEKSLRYSDACKGRMSFKDGHRYTAKDYSIMLGINKEQFQAVHTIVSPFLRNTCARSTEDALAIFFMKLRLNPSVNTLACLFNTTKQRISHVMNTVRKVLVKHFARLWLGYSHITRRDYIDNHTTVMSKTLTGATEEQAISVIDGTYLFHYKSSNYSFQRKSFSLHKFKNLIKVMNIVSTTGYILEAEGPYYGNGENNDANILKSMQKDRDGFRSFFVPGDFIIEDRGFRDSNELMTSLGFSIKMPHFLGKRAQHPTSEANESRLVTKIRWIVESVNGRIKNVFRFFRDTIPNTYVKNNAMYELYQIACALLNAFYPPIAKDKDNDKWLAEQMLIRSEMQNLLKHFLEEENLIRHTLQWEKVNEACLNDFPKLTMSELRELTFGVYQLKQAPSYMADTINEDGEYDIYYHSFLQQNAVKFRVQSRHQNSKQRDLWIGYNNLNEGTKSITGWYCKCPNGSRIVGCCAHVAAIIWYLSYARYCQRIIPPAADLDSLVRNAKTFSYENEFVDLPVHEEEALILERGGNLTEDDESSD